MSIAHVRCFGAALLLVPAQLSSQSWLTYRGTVDARFNLGCSAPEGSAPIPRQEGPFAFIFVDGEITSQGGFGKGKVFANGTASGGSPSFRWEGQFRWGTDGSVEGFGTIGPQQGGLWCTGTWTVGKPAGSQPSQPAIPSGESAVCEQHRTRMLAAEERNRNSWPDENPYDRLIYWRDEVQQASRNITGMKANTLIGYVIADEQERRRYAYVRIKAYDKAVKEIEAAGRELVRVTREAREAGCISYGGKGVPRTAADKAIDEVLALDSPPIVSPIPVTSPAAEIMAVAGIKGQVEVRSQDGTRYTPRDGARIGLNTPITIRTWPGSSVTIQVGSARKTLQPNTSIGIVTTLNGRTYILEEGAASVDVRKPGAYQIQTSAATVSVINTMFTVSHNATTGVTGVMVEDGRVTVQPKNPGVRGVTLSPGEYVEVGRNAMTAVLPAPGAPDSRVGAVGGGATQNIDLTGLWRDDTSGGAIYRLRQVGNALYWIVDGTPKGSYVNLSYGQISGNTITGVWVDLPGSPSLSGGDLTLRIESNDRLVKVGSPGYGAQAWVRVSGGGNRP